MPKKRKDFAKRVRREVERYLHRYVILKPEDSTLIYRLPLDDSGLPVQAFEEITRAHGGYLADIVVGQAGTKKGRPTPLVVLEVKGAKEGSSTHDAIVYSDKARAHKRFYPYLRYGLTDLSDFISYDRTIYHSPDFDFIVALGNRPQAADFRRLARALEEQADVASSLLEVIRKRKSIREYRFVLRTRT